MTTNPYLAYFANEPSLLDVNSGPRVSAAMGAVEAAIRSIDSRMSDVSMEDPFWPVEGDWLCIYRPYKVIDGILHIPVKGVLLHDFPYQLGSWATGYIYIQKALERGVADAGVRGIALVIDSPGGAVAGNFDVVDKIYEARSVKPIAAFAAEHAYSAAYSIASAASTLTVARTGGVGSIGVVTSHWDMSKALDEAGYRITFIHAGKHKVDGNAYEPLAADAKARIQSRIDALYDVFVATVARNRGVDEGAIRATEALTYTAAESLSNKLADAIGSLDDGLAAFAVSLNPNEGETIMSTKQDNANVDQATVDAARAEGAAEGHTAGVKAENARIAGIMALDESKTRVESALNLALTTNMTVEQAKGFLATVPVAAKAEEKPAANVMFEKAMAEGNPELGAGADGEKSEETATDSILGSYRQAGGYGLKN